MDDKVTLENIKRGIIILALDNTIKSYEEAIALNYITNPEDLDEANFVIDISKEIINDLKEKMDVEKDTKIKRPKWS
jgi:flagellin-specific chaperone FliS